MNVVILQGNLTRDPKSRKVKTSSGNETTVTTFTIATSRRFERKDGTKDKKTTFVDCDAWDSGAEIICKYVHKGDPLLIRGSLELDQWETEDGQKRSKLKVRVSEFNLLYRSSTNRTEPEESESEGTEEAEDPAAPGEIPF